MPGDALLPADRAGNLGGGSPAVARFGTTLVGRPREVREALVKVVGWLEARGVSADDRGRVELALAETLNNIVKHALAGDRGCGIDLTVARFPRWIDCDVRDGGLPMPSEQLPPGLPPAVDRRLRDLPEGGFGWFLIRELAACLRYTREGGINHLTFRIDLID